jgi:soluble lytic murein transglycosylase
MFRRLTNIFIYFILLISATNCFAAENYVAKAMEYAKKKEWSKATSYARKSGNKEVTKIVTSMKFQDKSKNYSFEEMAEFLSKNPYWPDFAEIKACAEDAITPSTNKRVIVNWFRKYPPMTPKAIKAYAYAEADEYKKAKSPKDQDKARLVNAVREAWTHGIFSKEEEKDFQTRFKAYLTYSDHFKRIDELLWLNNVLAANRLIHLMDKNDQSMFKARIAIITHARGFETLFNNLPDSHKYKSGVLYSYIKYYHNAEPDTDMSKLLVKAPHDTKHAHDWWRLKTFYIREMIKLKKYKKAYKIAEHHHAFNVQDTVDAHWLAGWIALNFLKRPEDATKHFRKLYDQVSFPISLSRGAYWLAESYKAQGKQAEAKTWYKKAAIFPETFYGQVSALKLNISEINLPGKPKVDASHIAKLKNNEIINAASILLNYGCEGMALKYIKNAIMKSNSPAEILLILEFAKKKGSARVLIEAAKSAAHKKVLVAEYNFPKPYKISSKNIEDAFAYAIIRQESVFNVGAISTANAMGLMQLIEPTARRVAKELNVGYSKKKLLSDPYYNISLGTKYLGNMANNFNGSYIMAAAAYNAGPNPVHRWIEQYGDPRKMKNVDDIIHWIELIPYYQTRDYVMRAMENLQIYRYRLGKSKNLRLFSDLKRGA